MEFSEAKELLAGCVRSELRDHAFGDAEVFWEKDGIEVASGYFGSQADVWFVGELEGSFGGDEARELRKCGTEGRIDRNDEMGPDEYAEGEIMPKLTKEFVRTELESGW
jgi:hypothetical protein